MGTGANIPVPDVMSLYTSAKYYYDCTYQQWLCDRSDESARLMEEVSKLCSVLLINEVGPKITNQVTIEQQKQYQIAV